MQVADPDGDVILVVGTENPVSVRASSKILTLVSPVFAAMLGPSFLEGSKLSDPLPYQIRLPEDDAEAVVWFCLVLHYQRKIDDHISLSLFEKLALLCNKYDRASALSSWSKTWLQKVNTFPKDQAHYERLLYSSYVYGIHEAFWSSSRAFLVNGLPNSIEANRPDLLTLGLDLLPEGLLESINHDREEIILSLLQTVEELIQPYLSMERAPTGKCKDSAKTQPYPNRAVASDGSLQPGQPRSLSELADPSFSPSSEGSGVCLGSKRVIHYFQELLRVGLWPITGSMRESTIKSILDKLQQYQNLPGDFSILFGGSSACDCFRIDFKQALQDAATKL